MKPAISVIIPVYKTEAVIKRCLKSLEDQTFQDFEIVIVNDCTPDNAMAIVESYYELQPKIKIINHRENEGLMYARRSGYQNASGKYYVFLDSDDFLPTNSLEILHREISNSKADIVISGFKIFGESKFDSNSYQPSGIQEFTSNECYLKLLNEEISHVLWGRIFKSRLFKQDYITFKNQTNSEDMILFYQVVRNCKVIRLIPDKTYYYCQDTSSALRSPMSKNKLYQILNGLNFKYQFLTGIRLNEKNIFKHIIPKVAWYVRYDDFKKNSKILNSEIRSQFKINKIYKYLSLKELIMYIIFDKTYILSHAIKKHILKI